MKATFTANTARAWAVLALLRLDKRPLFDDHHPDRQAVADVGTWALDTNARWFLEQLGPMLPVGVGPHGGQARALKTIGRLDRLTRKEHREADQRLDVLKAEIDQAEERQRKYAGRPDLDSETNANAARAEKRKIRRARSEQRRVITSGSRPVGPAAERERVKALSADIDDRAVRAPVKVTVRYVPRPTNPPRRESCQSNLEWARRCRGFRRRHVARRLGISLDTLRAWERGDGRPTFPQLRRLAEILQVALGVLRQP
jgi:DNA-binding transcriptional regulator YiaG